MERKTMKSLFVFITVCMVTFFTVNSFAQDAVAKKHAFIGMTSCKMCHNSDKIGGKQFGTWDTSKHAKAYQTLLTDKANEIATKKGLKVPAAKAPECLKCHASGYDTDTTFIGKKFKVEDGVQCETCHGAGADYKDTKIMKVKEDAKKNGLIIPDDKEKFCVKCHNAESPSFISFNYEEYWAKIKHGKKVEVK